MKHKLLLFVALFLSISAFSQVVKTVHVTTPGTLNSLMTDDEKQHVTDLTVTGSIDARDVRTMRDKMPELQKLNLLDVAIKAYTGTQGPRYNENFTYPENEFPEFSFYKTVGDIKLTSVVLPKYIIAIGQYAFRRCDFLEDVLFSNKVKTIKYHSFSECPVLKITLPQSLETIKDYCFWNTRFSYT